MPIWIDRIEKKQFDLKIALKSNLHTATDIATLNHNSAKDAILSFSPSIAVVKAYHGIDAIKIAVCALIADKSCRLIPSRQMNPQAYPLVASTIVEQYWFLKLSEIKYAFDCGFKQKEGYGGMFHGFDESVMMLWLESYIAERDKAVENIDKDMVAKAESAPPKILTDSERVETEKQTARILEIIEQFSVNKKSKIPAEFISIQQICKIYRFDESKVAATIKKLFEDKFYDVEVTQFVDNKEATALQQWIMWQRARLLRECSKKFGYKEGITAEMLFDLAKITVNTLPELIAKKK